MRKLFAKISLDILEAIVQAFRICRGSVMSLGFFHFHNLQTVLGNNVSSATYMSPRLIQN